MVNKIFIYITIISFALTSIITSKAVNQSILNFRIVLKGFYKTMYKDGIPKESVYIKLNKEIDLVKCNGNGLFFTDIKLMTENDFRYLFPKLDENGMPIELKYSKEYENKIVNVLDSTLDIKLISSDSNAVYLAIVSEKVGFKGRGRTFNHSNSKTHYQLPYYSIKEYSLIDNNINVIIVDSNFNYYVYSLSDNKYYYIKYSKAINPDTVDLNNFLGIKELIDPQYSNITEIGKGYLQITPNNSYFISAGKGSEMTYKPQLIGNKLYVNAQWFISQLLGYAEYDDYNKIFNFKRLIQPKTNLIELINIEVTYDSNIINRNGTKYECSSEIYFGYNYVMMPLRDLCQLLYTEILYRKIDNTYLIPRYNLTRNVEIKLRKM